METQFVHHKQGKIAYSDGGGSGPLVVCVPGAGDVRSSYRFLAPALREAGYRVVQMDLRGQGDSSVNWLHFSVEALAADLVALIDALGGGPALVIGAAMGGTAALWVGTEQPSKIVGLVLVSAYVRDLPLSFHQKFALSVLMNRWWGPGSWVKDYRKRYPTSPPADLDQYLSGLKDNLKQPGRLQATRALLRATKELGQPRLAQILAPALVVTGSADSEFPDPAAEGRFIAELLGAPAQTLCIEGAGHHPHVEMPDQLTPAVLRFFNRVQQGKASIHSA